MWFFQELDQRIDQEGRQQGWNFALKSDSRAIFIIFDQGFKYYIVRLKKFYEGVVLEKMNTEINKSLCRLVRWGLMEDVPNKNLDQVAIDTKNTLRKLYMDNGAEPSMSIQETYNKVESLLDTQINYCQCM